MTSHQLPPIVTQSWLEEHFHEVRLCDVRYYLDHRSGREAFMVRHLPGASYVDMDSTLAAPPGPIIGRHPMPTEEAFAAGLSSAGIGFEDPVVAYDDVGGMTAGRLVWMLRIIGQPAALLSGGLQAWTGEVEASEVEVHKPANRPVMPWPADAMATADEVASLVEAGGVVVDSRAPDRFRGEVEPIDPRAGHIPGAVNLPFAGNLDGDGLEGSEFMTSDELRARFDEAGVSEDAVFYCGSGVSACHNVLAVEAAGLGRPKLYVGSWSGWSSDPGRLAETAS